MTEHTETDGKAQWKYSSFQNDIKGTKKNNKTMMKIKSPSKNLFKAEVVKVSSLKTTSKGS